MHDRAGELVEKLVGEALVGTTDREDGDVFALTLQLDELCGDEGLRQSWKALEHVTEMPLPGGWGHADRAVARAAGRLLARVTSSSAAQCAPPKPI